MKRKAKDKLFNSNINKIVQKLLMNNEVEMCEFAYDIKLYENIGLLKDRTISYTLEIFSLNDPEVIYCFNHPIYISQNSKIQTSMETIVDVLNLVEHPLKKNLQVL